MSLDGAPSGVSRRGFIGMLGSGSAIGLAGCLGDGTGFATQHGSPPTVGDDDVVMELHETTIIDEKLVNLNMFAGAGQNVPTRALEFVSAKMGYRDPQTGERIPGLVREWEWDETEVRIEFHPEAHYSNGDPIDPLDFGYGLMLWPLMFGEGIPHEASARRIYTAIEDVSVEDNVLVLNSPNGYLGKLRGHGHAGPELWEQTLYSGMGWRHFANFRDIAEEYWNLRQSVGLDHADGMTPSVSEEDLDTEVRLRAELFTRIIEPHEALTTGPFRFSYVGEGNAWLERHPGYAYADQVNWDYIQVIPMLDDRTIWGAIESEKIDGVDGLEIPAHVAEGFPDHYTRVLYPTDTVTTLQFNIQRNYFDDYRVRQALGYAIDTGDIAASLSELNRIPESWPDYLRRDPIQEWGALNEWAHTEPFIDDFNTYQLDFDRATELLQAAGFEHDGEWWQTPAGERWHIQVNTRDQDTAFESSIESQLTDFGIDITVLNQEQTVFEDTVHRGHYQVIPNRRPSAYGFSLEPHLQGSTNRQVQQEHGIWEDESESLLADFDYTWGDEGNLVMGDTVQSYHVDQQLLDFYADAGLDILTWQFDIESGSGIFERFSPDEVRSGAISDEWVDHRLQLQLRLRIAAPPLGSPTATDVEWPAPFLRGPGLSAPPPVGPANQREHEHLVMADKWVANHTVVHIPMFRHWQQGYLNTDKWGMSDRWMTEPNHFRLSTLAATGNLWAL